MLNKLPNDLILMISNYLHSEKDCVNLMTVSKCDKEIEYVMKQKKSLLWWYSKYKNSSIRELNDDILLKQIFTDTPFNIIKKLNYLLKKDLKLFNRFQESNYYDLISLYNHKLNFNTLLIHPPKQIIKACLYNILIVEYIPTLVIKEWNNLTEHKRTDVITLILDIEKKYGFYQDNIWYEITKLIINEKLDVFPHYHNLWLFNSIPYSSRLTQISEYYTISLLSYLLKFDVNSITKFWFLNIWRFYNIPLDIIISLVLYEIDIFNSIDGYLQTEIIIIEKYNVRYIEWIKFIYNDLLSSEKLDLDIIINDLPELTKKYMFQLLHYIKTNL